MPVDFSFLAKGTRSPIWDLLEGVQVGQQIAANKRTAQHQAAQLALSEKRVGMEEQQLELAKQKQTFTEEKAQDPLQYLSGDNLRQYLAYTDKGKEILGTKGQKKLQEEFDARLSALQNKSQEDLTLKNVTKQEREAADTLLSSQGIDFGDDSMNQTIGNLVASQAKIMQERARDAKQAIPPETVAQQQVLQQLITGGVIIKQTGWGRLKSGSHNLDMDALNKIMGVETPSGDGESTVQDKLRVW